MKLMGFIEIPNPNFESCEDCIYSDDNEEVCILRGCIHAVTQLSECYKPKQPQRTGKWERHYSRPNVYADLYWHCSECGYKNDDQYANVYHKFCPNCGAKMEGR